MQIESAPDVRQNLYERPPRLITLLALVSHFALAYGDIANAQQPQITSSHPFAKKTADPFQDVQKTIEESIPELNHTLYPVREKAQLRIKQAIREALERKNPLPETLKKSLVVPYESGGTIETFKRMEDVRAFTDDMEAELPGRISPDNETSIQCLLETQFHCRITVDDPLLQRKLEQYEVHAEGEKSGDAFVRMCRDLQAIPVPTPDGFLLRPIQDGEEFRANDTMGLINIGGPKIQYREAFLLPDKGVILSLITEKTKTEEEFLQEEMAALFSKPEDTITELIPTKTLDASLVAWSKDEYQQTPKHKTWTPLSQKKFDAITARKPMTYTLPTADTKMIPAGLQTLCIPSAPEKQSDGSWVTVVKGTILECIDWPKTTNEEDMFSYQLVAANKILGTTKDGRTMHGTLSDLHFCKRDMSFSVTTAECPTALQIRAFTSLQQEQITLP